MCSLQASAIHASLQYAADRSHIASNSNRSRALHPPATRRLLARCHSSPAGETTAPAAASTKDANPPSLLQRRQALLLLQGAALCPALPPRAAAVSAAAAAVATLASNSFTVEPPFGFVPFMTPEPVAFPRRQLDLPFAVLLLRSCYDALDALDFIPMQLYQKQFWKLRANEWKPYTVLNEPLAIKQGDLSNPLYFDFISFSQSATTSEEMARGQQEFDEQDEESEEGATRHVRRDPALRSNAALPGTFSILAGDAIYDRLHNGFRDAQFGGPSPARRDATLAERVAGVDALLGVFRTRGYALSIGVGAPQSDASGRGGAFAVRIEGPANLWAVQALAARRAAVFPLHSALAVGALLRAGGATASCRVSFSDTALVEAWTVVA